MILQQVIEGEDRGLIQNPIAHQVDTCKPAHGWHLNQGIFHGWIAVRLPLLKKMNPQHHGQGVRRLACLIAGYRIMECDKFEDYLPEHHRLYLSQELFSIGPLLGGCLPVIREAELFAADYPSPG